MYSATIETVKIFTFNFFKQSKIQVKRGANIENRVKNHSTRVRKLPCFVVVCNSAIDLVGKMVSMRPNDKTEDAGDL